MTRIRQKYNMASQPKSAAANRALLGRLLFGLLVLHMAVASADGLSVSRASTRLVDEVYHLDARIHYGFNAPVLEALESGVPITVEVEIEVVHPRRWIWNETVYSLSQRYRIRYHALTRQYLVTNLNSDVQLSYPTRAAALRAMGTIRDLPILDRRLLKVGERYQGQLRASIVLSALPSPLRVWAYLSRAWRQESDWYTWPLQR